MAKKETSAPKKIKETATPKKAAVAKKAKASEKEATPKKAAAPKKAAVAKKEVAKKVAAPKKAAAKKATAPKKEAAPKTVAKKAAAPKKAAAKKVAEKPLKAVKKGPVNPDQELLDAIVDGILDKKGHEIVVMDLRPSGNGSTDWFVVCHGNSNTQAAAIANSVEDMVRKTLNAKPWHMEGFENGEWILLDYVNVVVHVFQEPIRDFYRLEDLWADAPTTKVAESFTK